MERIDPDAQGKATLGKGKANLPRRQFLKQTVTALGAVTAVGRWTEAEAANISSGHFSAQPEPELPVSAETIAFPRVFRGSKLKMISFPLGGVAAGSLGLGGRGQLRDWEIFNRPNQGGSPAYAFPAIWIQSGNSK